MTFTVNTTNDTHDASPGDGVCADATSQCSLRAAIEEANALGTSPAHEAVGIVVPADTYTLTIGALAIADPAGLTITGAGAGQTTIDAGHSSGVFVVNQDATADGSVVSISGITATNGHASGADLYVSNSNDAVVADADVFSGGTGANTGGGSGTTATPGSPPRS